MPPLKFVLDSVELSVWYVMYLGIFNWTLGFILVSPRELCKFFRFGVGL